MSGLRKCWDQRALKDAIAASDAKALVGLEKVLGLGYFSTLAFTFYAKALVGLEKVLGPSEAFGVELMCESQSACRA